LGLRRSNTVTQTLFPYLILMRSLTACSGFRSDAVRVGLRAERAS